MFETNIYQFSHNNYLNKVVSKLEIDGQIIDKLADISKAQFKFYQDIYSDKLNETTNHMKTPWTFSLKIIKFQN